jgi:hypothetical protein
MTETRFPDPGLALVIFSLLVFPFLFPEEFTYWSRRIRQWLASDFRKRTTPNQWDEFKDAFQDF